MRVAFDVHFLASLPLAVALYACRAVGGDPQWARHRVPRYSIKDSGDTSTSPLSAPPDCIAATYLDMATSEMTLLLALGDAATDCAGL